MIKHFAADGTVKREWPDGLHAAGFEQDGKRFASVSKSNAIETVELADGEQVGETFVAAIASALVAADVHPIETALSAAPLPPVAISPDPEPSDIVMGTGPDAKPVIETELGELVPASTEHHVPLPSEVVETAAHALSDAAEVLKQEEARNASEVKSV
jgi:hypothetical protein